MESRALILATILRVKDGHFIFPFCNVCYCKVTGKGSSLQRFACTKCNQSFDVSQLCYRYRLSATISDGSVACDVSIFGKCLEVIFGTQPAHFNRILQRHINPRHPTEESRDEALHKTMTGTIVGKQFYFGFKVPSKKQTLSTLKQVLYHKHPHCSSTSGIPDGLVAYQIFTHTFGPLKPSLVEILEQRYAPPNQEILRKDINICQKEGTAKDHADRKVVCDDSRCKTNSAIEGCDMMGNNSQIGETSRSQQTMNVTDASHEFTTSSDFSLGMTTLEVTCDTKENNQTLEMSVDHREDLSSQQLLQPHLNTEKCEFETQLKDMCYQSEIFPTSDRRQRVINHNKQIHVGSSTKVPKVSVVCNLPSPILNKSVNFISSLDNGTKDTESDVCRQRHSFTLQDMTPVTKHSPDKSGSESGERDSKEKDSIDFRTKSSHNSQNVTSCMGEVSGEGTVTASKMVDIQSQPGTVAGNVSLAHAKSFFSCSSELCTQVPAQSTPSNEQPVGEFKSNQRHVSWNCSQSYIESSSQEIGKEQSFVGVKEPDASAYFDGADLPLSEDFELFLQRIEAQYADQVKGGNRRVSCKKLEPSREKISSVPVKQVVNSEGNVRILPIVSHQSPCNLDSEVPSEKLPSKAVDQSLTGCYDDSVPSDTSAFSYTGSQELFSQSYIDCQAQEDKSTSCHVCEESNIDINSESKIKQVETTTGHRTPSSVDQNMRTVATNKDPKSKNLLKTASHSTPLDVIDHTNHTANTLRERNSMLMKSALGTPLLFSQDVISPVENHSRSRNNFLTSKSNSRRVSRRHQPFKAHPATRLLHHQPRHISPYVTMKKEASLNWTQPDSTCASYKSYIQNGTSTPDLFLDDDESYPSICNKTSYVSSRDDSPDLFSPTQHTSHQDLNMCNDRVDLRKKLFVKD